MDIEPVVRDNIAERRRRLVVGWEEGWQRMTRQWQQDGPDAVWLLNSANYLLRTAGVRWAIDPVTLKNLVPEARPVPVDDLASLDFILLTHNHSDHVDPTLLKQLAAVSDTQWLIPRHMLPIAKDCGVHRERMIVPEPMQPVSFGPVRVTVFDGLHWEYSGQWRIGSSVAGIEAAGCLVEWKNNRVLFPGDTRTYDTAAIPSFVPVDIIFAHVWLGRGAALATTPPLIDAMCDFVVGMSPLRRVLLTHLWQVAREAEDYWDATHAAQVKKILDKRLPGVDVCIPEFWREVVL